MRRLLKFGTFLFILITVLAPLSECFDRWDAPGISNDTEFAVFALILILCLVLLVSKLVSTAAQSVGFDLISTFHRLEHSRALDANRAFKVFIPPRNFSPLRI